MHEVAPELDRRDAARRRRRRQDRRGRGLRPRGPGEPRLPRPDAAERLDVRPARPRVRLPLVRDPLVPQPRLRGRGRGECGSDPRARADARPRRDARAARARRPAAPLQRARPALPGARRHARARRPAARPAAVRAAGEREEPVETIAGPASGSRARPSCRGATPRRARASSAGRCCAVFTASVTTSPVVRRGPRARALRDHLRARRGMAAHLPLEVEPLEPRLAPARAAARPRSAPTPCMRLRQHERHLVVRRERAPRRELPQRRRRASAAASPARRRSWASAASRRGGRSPPRSCRRRPSAPRPRSPCSSRSAPGARRRSRGAAAVLWQLPLSSCELPVPVDDRARHGVGEQRLREGLRRRRAGGGASAP